MTSLISSERKTPSRAMSFVGSLAEKGLRSVDGAVRSAIADARERSAEKARDRAAVEEAVKKADGVLAITSEDALRSFSSDVTQADIDAHWNKDGHLLALSVGRFLSIEVDRIEGIAGDLMREANYPLKTTVRKSELQMRKTFVALKAKFHAKAFGALHLPLAIGFREDGVLDFEPTAFREGQFVTGMVGLRTGITYGSIPRL